MKPNTKPEETKSPGETLRENIRSAVVEYFSGKLAEIDAFEAESANSKLVVGGRQKPNTPASETPRTDAATFEIYWALEHKNIEVTCSQTGRQLETELATAIAEKQASDKIIKQSCDDWAQSDTTIKAICEKFGIAPDNGDDYFKCSEECVQEFADKFTQLQSEKESLQTELTIAFAALKSIIQSPDYPDSFKIAMGAIRELEAMKVGK